ncbi:glycosyltransferase family 2 protein [Candidatus Thiodictyon syntrophicum]|jgi:glycosyltransferase involved in cell wall biosynthesis|nr:glycosyltransferase family A protein [Candidatus Thiodictyon syntrophicum]
MSHLERDTVRTIAQRVAGRVRTWVATQEFWLTSPKKYTSTRRRNSPCCTIVIAHKNAPEFVKACLQSIATHTIQTTYEIIVADDCSAAPAFSELLAIRQPYLRLYRFRTPHGHSFVLEWLYRKARSPYVLILDQDTLLLSNRWETLLDEFQRDLRLTLIGMRDQHINRHSPRMVHPSFLLINKTRCSARLQPPFFVGERPGYEGYEIGQQEPYHALSCKALLQDPHSIGYLDTHPTQYGLGCVGYYRDVRDAVVYHQWYSGRLYTLNDDDVIDGHPARSFRQGINKFWQDYYAGQLDMSTR